MRLGGILSAVIACDNPLPFVRDRVRRRISVLRRSMGDVVADPLTMLLDRFETLGDSCEFSALQRQHGVQRPALFHWRSTSIPMLAASIASDLEKFDDPRSIEVELGPAHFPGGAQEYLIRNKTINTIHHSFQFTDAISLEDMRRQELRRLSLLRRKFLEDVAAARRIYVFRSSGPVATTEAQTLADTLRSKGDNHLLWVVEAAGGEPPGEVVSLGAGLYRATVDRLAPGAEAMKTHSKYWPVVLRTACRLVRPSQDGTIRRAW